MLKRMQGFQSELESFVQTPIPISPDGNGMIDKQCPKDECGKLFKVNFDDWRSLVKDDACFCPACRNNSPAADYLPSTQRSLLVKNVRKSIMDNWHHNILMLQGLQTLYATKEFEVAIKCEKCDVRFSVVGAAYFCPGCGYNSIKRTAVTALDKLILTANNVGSIQQSLEETQTKDDAAILVSRIIESAVSACIGTLQAFSEAKYNQLSAQAAPFNAFQNVDKANKLWLGLKGQGYDQWLTVAEISLLNIFTQRRHLLEHKGGIVDTKYLTASNDTAYITGDRLVIRAADIVLLAQIILKIIEAVNSPNYR